MPKRSPRRRHAFTLIELLVVIAIIALLLSVLMPALGKARAQGKTIVCLANQRSMGQSFVLYCGDHKDAIVSSWTDTAFLKASWTDWPKTEAGVPLNDAQLAAAQNVDAHIRGVRDGALWPYTQDFRVYHCPSDNRDRFRTNAGANLAWVTYSLPNYIRGDDGWEVYIGAPPPARAVRRLDQISRSSENFSFLEESDPRGFNINSWVMLLNTPQWIDPLTVWHGDRSTIGFTDGHAEIHPWKDRRTINMSRSQQFNQPAVGNADYQWLKDRWWRR